MKDLYLTHINEAMNALISANNIPGLKGNSNSVYIVNYMQNNAFAQGLTTDYKMRHMITRDPDDSKLKMKSVDNQDEYGFDNTTDIKGVYRVLDKAGLSEALEKIESNLGNEINEGFIYECILGDKMYTWDQIEFNDKVEKIVPYDELIKGMNESIRNYTLYGKEKAELLAEIKYGDKDLSTIMEEYKNTLLNETTEAEIRKSSLEKAKKTQNDVMDIINSLDSSGKKYLKLDNKNKEYPYLTPDQLQSVLYRALIKDGNIPVSFCDILIEKFDKNNTCYCQVGLATRQDEKYRGKGYASKAATEAVNFIKNNKNNLYNKIILKWEPYNDNIASIEIAKKLGFKLDHEKKDKNILSYVLEV